MDKFKKFLKDNKSSLIRLVCMSICFSIGFWFFTTHLSKLEQEKIKTVPYTEFLSMVENGEVDTVYYSSSKEEMTFTLYNEETKNMSVEELEKYEYSSEDKRVTTYPAYDTFRKDLLEKDVKLVIVESENGLMIILDILLSLGLPILWIVVLFSMIKGQTRGLDKDTLIQTSNVKFDNVIGQDEILDDIKFIAELIKDPTKGDDIGVKLPKGILLSGEPGTGKTLIAKAIAGEAGVPFISIGGSDFKELFVGMGAKRVRDTFKIAREHAPCIIFIDEIDAVGAKRDSRGSTSEDDQTINALLKEMDGFSGREGIFVIAATNRPDKLDSALVRAGRFDRQVVVNKPRDWKVRLDMFNYYIKNYKLSDNVNLEVLSKQCSGFTGADISTICNEAGLIAVMKNKSCIDNECLEEAIDKKVFKGNRAKEEHFKDDKRIVAYHEAGHAVASYLLGHEISRASIIATTSGVGGAVFGAETDSVFVTDKELRERVIIDYAGRASEELKFKIVTTGASNDITQATHILAAYVKRYGFDKEFGLLDMQVLEEQSLIESSEITSRLSNMSCSLYKECFDLLEANYDKVELLANKLLEVETLSGNEIIALFKE